MFDAWKKLTLPPFVRPSFRSSQEAGSIPLNPSAMGGFEDPALRDRPRLLNRVLEGLPGFVGGAGAVFAAKSCVTAFCASVSAPAIATAAAAVTTGAVASQLLTYVRERKAELKVANGGRDVSLLRSLTTDFDAAAAKREIKTFFSKDNLINFGKGALTKGVIAGGLGAAFGLAAQNGTIQTYAHKAYDVVRGFNPLEKLQHALLGKPDRAHSVKAIVNQVVAEKVAVGGAAASAVSAAVDKAPALALAHPLETVVPVAPPTPLEKVRILMDVKGLHNTALDKLLERAEAGNAQAMKDLSYGLRWGKLGLVQMKDLADDMLKEAADKGNAQAIHDRLVLAGKVPPTVAAPAPVAVPAAIAPAIVQTGMTDDTRERAAAFIKAAYGSADAAAATKEPAAVMTRVGLVTEDMAPTRIADEAARCIMEQVEKGRMAIRSLCSRFADVVKPGEHVLMQTADGQLSVPYINDGEAEKDAQTFMRQSRRDFRDHLFVPFLKGQPQ